MKKYLILFFLFLLVATPVLAKDQNEAPKQQNAVDNKNTTTVLTTKAPTISPTRNQVKNRNEIKTQNQSEDIKETKENKLLNKSIDDDLTKVSDQVHELIETVGAKGGIGQEVKVIAQKQVNLQDKLKSDHKSLTSRGAIAKFFIGSNKKLIKSIEKNIEQNRLIVQELEKLKLQTKDSGDLQKIQETIDLMNYQNTSLQGEINQENKVNGLLGWLVNLF